MIASLPMYDRRETAAALDRLWCHIRAHLDFKTPSTLTRGGNLWDQWQAPDLVLSQTCGYPYRARLKGHVQLVASPQNDLPGCPPGHYNSVFVTRADDPRRDLTDFADAVFAFSEPLSQSGWAAPQNHVADLGFTFSNDLCTGAHIRSARAVAERSADIACLDAVSWRLIQQHEPYAANLQEITRTAPTPAPPFITAPGQNAAQIRAALAAGIDAIGEADRETLGLYGLTDVPEAAYLAVPNPAPPRDPRTRV